MSEASELMEGILWNNVAYSEYTAVLKDISFTPLDDYESQDEDAISKYMFKAYLIEADLVEGIFGETPKSLKYIGHTLKKKPFELSEKPYILSFCKSDKGNYFVHEVMKRIEATESSIKTAKEAAQAMRSENRKGECDVSTKYFLPKNY